MSAGASLLVLASMTAVTTARVAAPPKLERGVEQPGGEALLVGGDPRRRCDVEGPVGEGEREPREEHGRQDRDGVRRVEIDPQEQRIGDGRADEAGGNETGDAEAFDER